MCCSFRYAQILIGFCWFPTAIAIYLSIWVAPSDFQQGENYRIIYVHVPAAWMSLLIYIAMAISSVSFLLTKHPLFQLFSKTGAKIGASFTWFTLVTGGFWGKPMWGTFWVWDARLTSVLILFFIYLGALRFQEFSADVASISICIGPINIPIIKFPVNWWNTLHQPSSISQFGTSIHISMPIPIFLIFASSFFLTGILFILETRQIILSFYLQRKSQ
jgi:heme exporter protein CcmC